MALTGTHIAGQPGHVQDHNLLDTTKADVRNITSISYATTATPVIVGSGETLVNIGTLTGNIVLGNPTGTPLDGQPLRVRFTQDSVGGRTVTLGSTYTFSQDITSASIPTTANTRFMLQFLWNAVINKWEITSLAKY